MSFPTSLDTPEYYEQLREFRDSALEKSKWHGRRINLAGLECGTATAGWHAQGGGIADLEDAGVRIRGTNLIRSTPTTLRILNRVGKGHEITTYKMDLDEVGFIEVYSNMFIKVGVIELIRAGLSRNAEIEMGLHHPTEAHRELLFTELQRGASGDYITDRTH